MSKKISQTWISSDSKVASAKSASGFNPDFSSSKPLETLGLTVREVEVLLWVAQGKSNGDVAVILNMAEKTVRKHMSNIFEKLGLESRNAATMSALEILSATPKIANIASSPSPISP